MRGGTLPPLSRSCSGSWSSSSSGYFIAKAIAKAADVLLERVGFDRAVERGGVGRALANTKYDASE